ncbi:hypothetical protein ACS3SW_06650 [Roseobacteraceae bacterium S113]
MLWLLIVIAMLVPQEDAAPAETAILQAEARTLDPRPAQTRVAEDQTPTGRFLTAAEVRPILGATRANWVAVREFNGQDLVYVTHLLAWRCGLYEIGYSINEEPEVLWPMPACHVDSAAPAALLPEDGLPYIARPKGSVERLRIRLLYDDLSEETGEFTRAQVLVP